MLLNRNFPFQTPHGLLEIDVDYDEVMFNESLKLVQRNYFGQYLPEIFENRVPRRLPPIDISNDTTPITATPILATPIPIMATPNKAKTSKATTAASSSKAKPRPTRFILDDESCDEYFNLMSS